MQGLGISVARKVSGTEAMFSHGQGDEDALEGATVLGMGFWDMIKEGPCGQIDTLRQEMFLLPGGGVGA